MKVSLESPTAFMAVALVLLLGCAGTSPASPSPSANGGTGGSARGTGGNGRGGADATASGGREASGGQSGQGGQGGQDPGGQAGPAQGGQSGQGGAGSDAAPADVAPETAPSDTASDTPAACGQLGQLCCAANACSTGRPSTTGETGTTVLELHASGGDPYALFAAKNLLPIDGPDSGYITDDGTSFRFVLHQDGAEEVVSSGARRQRNEVTVNPSNPAIYKAMRGDTMSYTWRFRLEQMNADPTWCDIFQIKQHGPLGVAPYMAFEANKGELTIDTEKAGVIRRVPLSAIMNTWINARVTIVFADAGSLSLSLTRDDGTVVLSYSNDRIDMWDTTVDFVRPKWGLYRNKKPGAGEAAIRYNDMKIIRGKAGPVCTCGS